jgi:hypothetical protein
MSQISLVTIPWTKRILGAISTFLLTILVGVGCLLVAPIAALNVLFTSKEVSVNIKVVPGKPKSAPPNPPQDDDPDAWKKAHDEEYGNGA